MKKTGFSHCSYCGLLNVGKFVGMIEILTIHSHLLNLSPKTFYSIKQQVLESRYRFVMLLSFCPFSDFPLLFLFMIALLNKSLTSLSKTQ